MQFVTTFDCNGKCTDRYDPCNGTCLDQTFLAVGDRCLNKADAMVWLCNGYPHSWYDPCDGKCRGFEFLERSGRLTDFDYNYVIDTYYQCPHEEKCISSNFLCNNVASSVPGEKDSCKGNLHKSREYCDNPEKFGFSLNCSSRNAVQCPGRKTQQCIYYEDLCNGKFDCNDR